MKRSGLTRNSELFRHTDLRSDPEKVKRFNRPRAISPASPAQREKIKDRICVWCGDPATDPAHLCPRSRGGCDEAACVVPMCRICHTLFDQGEIDLESVIALRQYSVERSHMALHMSIAEMKRRLNGRHS